LTPRAARRRTGLGHAGRHDRPWPGHHPACPAPSAICVNRRSLPTAASQGLQLPSAQRAPSCAQHPRIP